MAGNWPSAWTRVSYNCGTWAKCGNEFTNWEWIGQAIGDGQPIVPLRGGSARFKFEFSKSETNSKKTENPTFKASTVIRESLEEIHPHFLCFEFGICFGFR